ncbi:MAG: hypothetical protein MRY83_06315, partial [Flavobacteriales bacterium]|nr:hypothetical protein [Flavobacteriales bacterium]
EIGVGTTSPDAKFNVGETSGANILLTREDVTTNTNDLLGQIKFGSTDGGVSTVDESVMLRAYASETHGSGDKGGYFTIETKTTNVNGNQAATERLRIADNGAITISDLADGSTRMVVASATGVLTTQPITSEISICEFLLSEAVSNGGQEVAFVVPSNLNGRTLVAGVAKGMTGAGTCTVTVYRNGSSVGSITNVGTTHQTATGWSTAVSTGDLITVGTSATSGTLNGLTVTISAQ